MNKLLAKYKKLEANGDHTEAAMLLVDTFGTEDEKEIIKEIANRHKKNGHIIDKDYELRYKTSNKYYKLLSHLNEKL